MPSLNTPTDPAGLLGRTLDGRYQALAFVGEGELGFVYRGEQTALHRACALKVLRPEVQRDQARLQQIMEGSKRVARRRFDALVAADDVLATAERTTLVLPWLCGEDLAVTLRRVHRLPWARVRELLLQVGGAQTELHAAGFMCTGLKPSNVFLVGGSDGGTIVKLLDVGLSHHDPATATITYMAPEWVVGGEPDSRSDVYNLAALAYEALTGEPVFVGPPAQIALLKRVKSPRPLRTVAPDLELPAPVEALLLRALERDPHARPNLAAFLVTVTEARGDNPPDVAGGEGVTRYFRRVPAAPRCSQSGEIQDDEPQTTLQFQRNVSPSLATNPGTIPPAISVEATRISIPRPPAPPIEATRISIPRPPTPPVEATAISIPRPPTPPVEATAISIPRPPAPPVHTAPSDVASNSLIEPPRAPALSPALRPAPSHGQPVEATQFLPALGEPATLKLRSSELTGVLELPGHVAERDLQTGQTSRTAVVAGFGGALLAEPGDATSVGALATPAAPGPPPRRSALWTLWDRFLARIRVRRPTTKPQKPGLWARLRGLRTSNLPARRGPTRLDKFFRSLSGIPSLIGRGWRMILKPFGRLTGLRSKLTAPLMALRTSFGRLTRLFSRWTGGGH